MEVNAVEQLSSTLAGVVAVDGGTIGLEVSFGAFLATILGLFIPVVFLITLFIQSDAQGTSTTFRQPDSIGGIRFEVRLASFKAFSAAADFFFLRGFAPRSVNLIVYARMRAAVHRTSKFSTPEAAGAGIKGLRKSTRATCGCAACPLCVC